MAGLRVFLCLPVFIALTGCAAHDINLDPAPLTGGPQAFSMSDPEAQALSDAWYNSFKDPALSLLIESALQNNLDVHQALARLKQAQAVTQQSEADFFPSIDLEANSSKDWQGSKGQEGVTRAGASLSWEIDAFNRLGANADASRYEEEAAATDIEAVRLTLSAEVAEAYFSAIAQQQQINLLEQQTQGDTKLLDLIDQRLKAGVGTNVEVLQQKSQLAENQSLIPPAQANLRIFENRLDVLAGTAPDAQNRTADKDVFAEIGSLPAIGVPSDLLLNRPDLRAQKNLLIAADADIGAAIADQMPRITLTGAHLYTDASPAGLVTSILGSIVQPLLDWGKRKAEVTRNEALYEERLAAFTQSYLEAIEDVENALYQENRQREYIDRLETRRQVLSQTVDAAQAIYKQGESDYLPVLDAVQDLRTVERNLITQRLNLVLYRIQLFRALGAPVTPQIITAQDNPV